MVTPSKTDAIREAMLAHRLGKWLEQLKSGYRDRTTESVRRHIESLLNEPNPVLAELEDAIGEAFDAFKVQTQDEDGGPLSEPEYSVPNAKRAFEGLAGLAEFITRPKEQPARISCPPCSNCGGQMVASLVMICPKCDSPKLRQGVTDAARR